MLEGEHVPEVSDPELAKKRARAIFATWAGITLFVTWMLVSSALDMWAAWESHNARETIVGCIIPEGECKQNSDEQVNKAITRIFKDGIDREMVTRATIIASVWCDEQEDVNGLLELEKCVKEQLALKERDRGDQ